MEKKDKKQACHTGANKCLLKMTNPFKYLIVGLAHFFKSF